MISRVWEATTAKRMQIDPYCQQQKCSPVNVLSSDIRVMQIFAGVREIWGVKQESGRLRCRFSYLALAIFSESSSPRLKLLYSNTYTMLSRVYLSVSYAFLFSACCLWTVVVVRSCTLTALRYVMYAYFRFYG